MRFSKTEIPGVLLIDIEQHCDERGFFGRVYCEDEFSEHGVEISVCQGSISYNTKKGTLRGMHYQVDPHPEAKLVRCTAGRIYDVVIDLRVESPCYCGWTAQELSADNRRTFYIPPGCAHGFITLTDDAEVLYLMADRYAPTSSRGVRWNDPAFAVTWPMAPTVISSRDASYPDFEPARGEPE